VSDQFVAEIRVFPFNFPPRGWAFCNGQILPISQNTALFSLLGTTYGGDGKSTFALPDLQGNAAMQPGQGQLLSLRDLGEQGGSETVTLLISEIPFHTHNFVASNSDAVVAGPANQQIARGVAESGGNASVVASYTTTVIPVVQMAPQALSPTGGSLPHNNMQPYLTLNYCIALQGIFPPRS
jgi:microcystin-dependent protein